ncbi:MAG: hypothetical protein JWP85_1992 [Rhodoglobus sp.]|nr:hypothetical protein [Rhodoglobus sp.]
MKQVTYAQKSLLVGDEAADVLLEYAAVVARTGEADTVNVMALGAEGNDVVATVLLGTGTVLMAETTNTTVAEPDNTAIVAYMRERIAALSTPPPARPYGDDDLDRIDRSALG